MRRPEGELAQGGAQGCHRLIPNLHEVYTGAAGVSRPTRTQRCGRCEKGARRARLLTYIRDAVPSPGVDSLCLRRNNCPTQYDPTGKQRK